MARKERIFIFEIEGHLVSSEILTEYFACDFEECHGACCIIGDWIDSKGKKHKGESDAPRYKALGNSIALPFWEWMAARMRKYLGDEPTMASLFDGIGGFPLAYSRCGIKPIWASEIEEFPIAVTKRRLK